MCSHCGDPTDPGEKFCQNCGSQLAPPGVAPASLPKELPPIEVLSSPAVAPSCVPQPPPEAPLVSGESQVPGKLVVGETGVEILLSPGKPELLIGRTDPVRNIYPDIDLAPYGGELNGVSRLHAKLEIQGSQWYIEDLNSTNFTFLNRQRLQPGQRYLIKAGDEIRLGLLRLEYSIN